MGSYPMTLARESRIQSVNLASDADRSFSTAGLLDLDGVALKSVRQTVLPSLFRNRQSAVNENDSSRLRGDVDANELLGLVCANPSVSDSFDRALNILFSYTVNDAVHVLEAIARRLGEAWRDDTRSFFDVSIAMARLQRIFYQYCNTSRRFLRYKQGARSVLLATPPGEQHLFGLSVAEYSFQLAGWKTHVFVPKTVNALSCLLAKEGSKGNPFDLLCLSWSSGFLTETLAATLDSIRTLLPEDQPRILAGGYSADRHHEFLAGYGVHCADGNASSAVLGAERLVGKSDSVGSARDYLGCT